MYWPSRYFLPVTHTFLSIHRVLACRKRTGLDLNLALEVSEGLVLLPRRRAGKKFTQLFTYLCRFI